MPQIEKLVSLDMKPEIALVLQTMLLDFVNSYFVKDDMLLYGLEVVTSQELGNRTPTVIVVGDTGVLKPEARANNLASKYPNSEIIVFNGDSYEYQKLSREIAQSLLTSQLKSSS